jgi:hypothetical protein
MTRRIRVFLLLALLILGATSLVAFPQDVRYEYYTDATYSILCGERIRCDGFIWTWGCVTRYYVWYDYC